MLSPLLCYLLLVCIRETISLSHESTDAFKSSHFNYTANERLIYPLAQQMAKEKLRYYSNDTGITIDCPLKGDFDQIQWMIIEPYALKTNSLLGRVVERIPDLLEPLANGSLVIKPFPPSTYRQDIHSITMYCLATNSIGTMISVPQRVRAVVSQYYEISVFDEYVIRGCTAVLRCHIPEYIKPYVSVMSWIMNSEFEIVGHGEKYSVFPSGELHVRALPESFTGYRCKIRNLVNNQTKLSSQGSIIVTDPSNSITPRIIDCPSIMVVEEGTDLVELPCAAQAKPAPTYSWYKVSKIDGSPHPLASHQRYEYRSGSLIIRNVRSIDANKYICVATNSIGEAKCETEVITFAPILVNIEPKKLVVELQQKAVINCTLYGYPLNKMIWIHNGLTVSPEHHSYEMQFFSGQSILVINAVANSDQGVWQCLALNSGGDSAIDSTQLILDGLPPYFIEVFEEQNVGVNDKISLKCVGTGHPIPMITWSLDGSELESRKREAYTLHKALWDEYIVDRNRIVSYLNITVSSVFDGGIYECVVKNKAGISRHSAKIKVSGPTKIRQMHNKNFTAMNDISLTCPLVGDEPKIIEWHKDDKKLPLNHKHRVHGNGTLEIMHLDKSDSGIYSCTAFGENNSDFVKQSFLMKVKVPPVIEGFSFDNKLQSAMRTRIYCNIAQGDQPVSIQFFKDDKPIEGNNRDDGIVVQEVDPFSLSLAIANLTSKHNGNYSCIASNDAATVSYSSYLLVNVPPKWIIEPKNTHAVEGNSVRIDCSADGFPIVQITWKRLVDSYNSEINTKGVHQQYILIRSGPKYQVFQNGTLKISSVEPLDESQYLCQGSNGIGPGLSTIVKLFVHIPAKFKDSVEFLNISVHQKNSLELVSDIIGDHPISLEWTFNSHKISLNSEYLIKDEVNQKGMTSTLRVKSVAKNNSGVYKCIAINAYLKSPIIKTYNVIIQEPPDPPLNISLASKSSQTIALSWKRPYDGNDHIKEFIIQYRESKSLETKNLSVFGNSTTGVLRGLHPSTEYSVFILSINSVDKSKPSKELKFITEEESPSGPPTRVQLTALDATSIRVEWYSTPVHQINGELKGFYIGYKALNSNDPFIYKTVQIKPNLDLGSAFSLILHGLRPYTHYSVIVQAYNNVGAGPRSDDISVRTGESIPSSGPTGVSCVSFSSQSVTVSWDSIPEEHINGVLKGYRVYYKPTNNKDLMKNEVTAQQNKLTLYGLQKNTNYSIAVNAFNQIGNSESSSIFCKTQEDLPSQPEAIKAFQTSPDSVIVSWKPPKEANGLLRKYTVYRKSTTDEEVNSFTVPSHLTYHKTSNLIRANKYAFWVTAWTAVGEGLSSNIVNVMIATKIPARIVSFSDQIERTVGENVELYCKSVGIPEPSIEWKVNGRTLESEHMVKNHRMNVLMNGSIRITNTTLNDSGNYSCFVSNIHGFDSVFYELKIKRDSNSNYPLSPMVEVSSVTSSSITIKWILRGEELVPIKAHEVYFRSSQNKEWKYYIITEDGLNSLNKTFSIEHLLCGNHYQIYMINVNTFGKSSPSDILNIRTLGKEPISPPLKTFITRINSTAVKLNLNTWKDGGCPFTSHPIIQWKAMDSNQWNLLFVNSVLESAVLNEITTNKNYKIKVVMKNSAGTTTVEYDIEPYGSPNNIYHISGHSPVQIAVEHYDTNDNDNNEVIPVLFTVLISVVLLLAGILAVFILFKAMQKRMNQNGTTDRTPNTNNIFRKVAFIQTKNSKRMSEPIDVTTAELTSLNCNEEHMRIKAYNKSTESVLTTSFQCKDDTNYKYVSIPKQEIPSDYYSIVNKTRKCNTNAKQKLMIDMRDESPNRYSLPNTMFETKDNQTPTLETHTNDCCSYLADNPKAVECVCCALFDPECCANGHNWQPICQFEPNSGQMASSFNNRKFHK